MATVATAMEVMGATAGPATYLLLLAGPDMGLEALARVDSVSCILNPYMTNRIAHHYHLSRDARKPVFGISDQVRHKPGCTVSEAG